MVDIAVQTPPSGSGWAQALQIAVNSAPNSPTELTNVIFPAGRLPWVLSGEPGLVNYSEGPFKSVTVPFSKLPLKIRGAPTTRETCPYCGRPNMWVHFNRDNVNDHGWATVLYQPIAGGGNNVVEDVPAWIDSAGTSPPTDGKTLRVTDLKFEGYRTLHSTDPALTMGVFLEHLNDFRVDHCCFEHTAGGALAAYSNAYRGIIDHTPLYNLYGRGTPYGAGQTIDYGISVHGDWTAYSVPFAPLSSVLGKYGPQTVFIEDCYISRWRHDISGHHGGYYVCRHNTFNRDGGFHTLDIHNLRDQYAGQNAGRGAEIYENEIIGCLGFEGDRSIMQWYGGSVQWFNNIVDTTYTDGFYFYDGVCDTGGCNATDVANYEAKDSYFWSNLGTGVYTPDLPTAAARHCAVEWARMAGLRTDANYPNLNPAWSIAATYNYKPYPYPHPLTIEGYVPPTTPRLQINSIPSNIPFQLMKMG